MYGTLQMFKVYLKSYQIWILLIITDKIYNLIDAK